MRRALIASSEAALARIDELETDGRIDADHAEALRAKFTHKRDLQQGDADHHAAQHVEVERELIAAQRNAIIQMRERGEIDNVVLRRLQADLDAAATRGVLNV
jgi:CPA1 family monovalent cation:H+ antiporter